MTGGPCYLGTKEQRQQSRHQPAESQRGNAEEDLEARLVNMT